MLALDRMSQRLDGGIAATLLSWWQNARLSYAKRRQQKKAIAELRALSDRLLADIGIERAAIASIVRAAGRDTSRRAR